MTLYVESIKPGSPAEVQLRCEKRRLLSVKIDGVSVTLTPTDLEIPLKYFIDNNIAMTATATAKPGQTLKVEWTYSDMTGKEVKETTLMDIPAAEVELPQRLARARRLIATRVQGQYEHESHARAARLVGREFAVDFINSGRFVTYDAYVSFCDDKRVTPLTESKAEPLLGKIRKIQDSQARYVEKHGLEPVVLENPLCHRAFHPSH